MTVKEYCGDKAFKINTFADKGYTIICFANNDSILLSGCTCETDVRHYGDCEIIFNGDKKSAQREYTAAIFA